MVVFLAVHLVYLLVTLLLKQLSGGAIGLVHDDDIIEIDIPNRSINLKISDEELAKRRTEQDAKGWQPANREREVSFALKVFGHFATSADKGAVRDKTLLK